MSQEPWKTDQWFVSPWNFESAVRDQLHFAKQIKFHDITLRDGEQQTGVIFTKDDKIRIAEALAEAGVHRIEAGMPVVSPSDTSAIKEIVKRNLGPQIFAFSRCMVDDVKRAVDCGVSGIVMEVPSSTHIIEYAYKWPLEKAIDLSIESTAYAHSQGLEIVFFPIDFSRAEMKWVLDLILRVANEGHMDALALVDTFGVVSPHAMQYLVRRSEEARQQTPGSALPHGLRNGNRQHNHGARRGRRSGAFHRARFGRTRRQCADRRNRHGAADDVWNRYGLEVRQAVRIGAAGGAAIGAQGGEQPAGGRRATVPDRVRHHRELVAELRQGSSDGAVPVPLGRGRAAARESRARQRQRNRFRSKRRSRISECRLPKKKRCRLSWA